MIRFVKILCLSIVKWGLLICLAYSDEPPSIVAQTLTEIYLEDDYTNPIVENSLSALFYATSRSMHQTQVPLIGGGMGEPIVHAVADSQVDAAVRTAGVSAYANGNSGTLFSETALNSHASAKLESRWQITSMEIDEETLIQVVVTAHFNGGLYRINCTDSGSAAITGEITIYDALETEIAAVMGNGHLASWGHQSYGEWCQKFTSDSAGGYLLDDTVDLVFPGKVNQIFYIEMKLDAHASVSPVGAGHASSNFFSGNGYSIYARDPDTGITLSNVTFKMDPVPQTIADFSASSSAGAIPLVVQFHDLSKGIDTSWKWDFGDNTTSDMQNPSHTYMTPGNYNVSLTTTGAGGADVKTITDFITVKAVQAVFSDDFTTNSKSPLTVNFLDESQGSITSWLWDFGDCSSSTEQNPFHTYQTDGVYTVSLTATGPQGSDTITKEGRISVFEGFVYVDPVVEGDIDNSNMLGIKDVIMAIQITTGIVPVDFPCNANLEGMDVNEDGRVGTHEVIYILRELAEESS